MKPRCCEQIVSRCTLRGYRTREFPEHQVPSIIMRKIRRSYMFPESDATLSTDRKRNGAEESEHSLRKSFEYEQGSNRKRTSRRDCRIRGCCKFETRSCMLVARLRVEGFLREKGKEGIIAGALTSGTHWSDQL